jgi:thiosulfate/3-mercaptopyruvate sulfurtransferase
MTPLVSATWLAAHLDDPGLVILDATLPPVGVSPAPDTYARYLEQHIPDAVFFDIEVLSEHATSLPHMLPAPEAFAAAMSALGVSDSAQIVIYEQAGVFSGPRARWMLRTFGAKNVSILNGGLQAWLDEEFPVASGVVHCSPAVFRARFNGAAVENYADMQKLLATRGQVLDARSAARFHGTAPEPRPGLRSGHMPWSISTPFTELVEDGCLKSNEELEAYFATKHVDLHRPITTTCGSGVTAAVVALALELAGATDISLYDGSWAEYASQPDSEIVQSLV